jgi:signal transduction histidine kinase
VVGDGTLEPRAGAFRDQSIEHVFAAIPEPTKLHLEVAANNGEYSFLAQEDVAEAVEQTGLAPAELVTCLTLGCSRYLLVLTFAEQLGPATAQVSLDRAQMGIGLARRVLAGASPDATAALDIQFTVGFLDHLGIGTLLTQSDGTIIGYNRALVTFLGDATPGETPAEFAALLQPHEDDDQLPLLQKCFEHHDQNEERPDFKMTVKLPTDATAQLRVLWLGEQADDLSSAIVLLPVSSDPSPMAPSADAFWTSVAASLRTELLAIADGVQAWSHSAYDVEHQEPSATVRDITAAARAIRSTLSEIDDLANQASDAGTTRLTDLTLILAEVMDEVGAWYPEVEAVCEYEGLPKILTDQDVLRQVLRNLISNSVKFCGKGQAKVNIKVEAIVEDGECRLEISDDGDGIPRAVLGQVFQYGRQADESNSSHPTGAGMSLSLTRKLVRRMGGEMQIESKRGKGVKVSITMPGQSLGDDDEKTADPSDS